MRKYLYMNAFVAGMLLLAACGEKPAGKPAAPEIIPASVSVPADVAVHSVQVKSDLQNVAALVAVAKEQGAKLVVTGYADSMTGSAEHNRQLSQQRAEVVADEIVKMGFAREQIETVVVGGVDTLSPITYNRRATVEVCD